ncbi:hypothetical protein F5Y09DRAFT_338003 [Xylaria sp. FL1042]|nr:hypothetical protein F5Y09DRAFT_338003 [Xylaria sp. FL1042]
MGNSQHHSPFHPELMDHPPDPTSRRGREQNQYQLPPIRQAIPELQLDFRPDVARTPPSAVSPVGAQLTGSLTPPEYVHSPSGAKRRRLSADEEREFDRANRVPRLYSLPQPGSRQHSPSYRSGPTYASGLTPPDSSNSIGREMIFGRPIMSSPTTSETHDRVEARPTLPSFPLLEFERSVSERTQGHASDDYIAESSRRPSLAPSIASGTGHYVDLGGQGYRPAGFGYSYHHPNRLQSLSVGSAHFDRTPFSPGAYGPGFPETYMRIGDFGGVPGGDGKQRKRRGNLPKETTDKLRSWFIAHLNHPYPTEDEKQELMKQTGLQMNQISNWFINARRRQLPTMINNARAESEATSRAAGSNSLPSTERDRERVDYDPGGKQQSDSEEGNYDDLEIDSAATRHRKPDLKRGSI